MPTRPPTHAPKQVASTTNAGVRGEGYIRAEGLQRRQYHGTDHASHEPGKGAGESGPDNVQGLDVVAGVDAMFLQPGFILADDMDVPVIDGRRRADRPKWYGRSSRLGSESIGISYSLPSQD